MSWHQTGDIELPEPMMTQFTDAYVRHQASICVLNLGLNGGSNNNPIQICKVLNFVPSGLKYDVALRPWTTYTNLPWWGKMGHSWQLKRSVSLWTYEKMCTLTQLHETSSGLLFEWWIALVTFVSNLHFQLMILHRGVPGFETACHCGVLVPLVDYAVAHLARVPCLSCSRTKEAYRQGNSLLPPAWWSIFRNKVLNDSCAFCRIESVFLLIINFTFFSLFLPLQWRFLCTKCFLLPYSHYNDVTMGAKASQITSLTIVYSTVYAE